MKKSQHAYMCKNDVLDHCAVCIELLPQHWFRSFVPLQLYEFCGVVSTVEPPQLCCSASQLRLFGVADKGAREQDSRRQVAHRAEHPGPCLQAHCRNGSRRTHQIHGWEDVGSPAEAGWVRSSSAQRVVRRGCGGGLRPSTGKSVQKLHKKGPIF